MANRVNDNIIMENARIIFRNFSGKESKYNRKGSRNFCVIIDDVDLAKKLGDEGWNIRILEAREEGDEPKYYLQVQVSYDNIPPKVYMVTRKTKTLLDDESIASLNLYPSTIFPSFHFPSWNIAALCPTTYGNLSFIPFLLS